MTLNKTVNSKVIDSPCSKTVHQTPSLPFQNVSYLAVDHVHSVCFQGQPQKKGISPCIPKRKIKDVKGVFVQVNVFLAHMFQMSPMLPQVWL